MKPRPLPPIAQTSIFSPCASHSLNFPSARRRRLVFSAPHRPLSVVTTMMPTPVTVSRGRVADMRGDVADLLAVGARMAHALLRLPHLGSGDHLHRLGDLPGVLHTPDFHPDFLGARHGLKPGTDHVFHRSSLIM